MKKLVASREILEAVEKEIGELEAY
jgi:hypothetical protein